MNKVKFTFSTLAFFAFSLALAGAAHAIPRTYVSMSGNDANTCAFNDPCRTFSGAHTKTDANGAIIPLETGSYGIVTITKAISIIAPPGVHAEVAPGNQNGITVQLGGITGVVVLRNLYLVSTTGANKGVDFKSGGALHVENCTFSGFDKGINMTAAPALLYVKDTTVRNVNDGIYLAPTAANTANVAKAVVEHCRIENYFQGLVAAGRYTQVTVRDSHFAGRSKDNLVTYGGIIAAPTSVGTTHIMVENCLLTNNYIAIGTKTDGVSFISLSQNVIYANQTGVFACCLSKIITFGNNRFEDNNDDGSFNLSTPLK